MTVEPEHGRRLVLGAVSLTMARPGRHWGRIFEGLRDADEAEIIRIGYFDRTPFRWVSLFIRLGLVDQSAPARMRMARRTGDLELSIELDVRRLLGASDDVLRAIFSGAIAAALNGPQKTYGTPAVRTLTL